MTLFSLAAIVFYVLTGENLFEGRSAAAAMNAAKSPERRSLLDVPTLAFELREREAAVLALDLALARATSLNAKDRPQNGRLFADSAVAVAQPGAQHRTPQPPLDEQYGGAALARDGGGDQLDGPPPTG